jgi:hypothetical protein
MGVQVRALMVLFLNMAQVVTVEEEQEEPTITLMEVVIPVL